MGRSNWSSMLDELLEDESDKMTPRDAEFLNSLDKQRESNKDWEPSDGQWRWLDDIYNRVFG